MDDDGVYMGQIQNFTLCQVHHLGLHHRAKLPFQGTVGAEAAERRPESASCWPFEKYGSQIGLIQKKGGSKTCWKPPISQTKTLLKHV